MDDTETLRLRAKAKAKASRERVPEPDSNRQPQQERSFVSGLTEPFQNLGGQYGPSMLDPRGLLHDINAGLEVIPAAIQSGVNSVRYLGDEADKISPFLGAPLHGVAQGAEWLGQGIGYVANKFVEPNLPGDNKFRPLGYLGPTFTVPPEFTGDYENARRLATNVAGYGVSAALPKMLPDAAKLMDKPRQVAADALSQSAYKIPPTVKGMAKNELLHTAQAHDLTPRAMGLEKLDAKVGELKVVAERLETDAIRSHAGGGVLLTDMLKSLDDLRTKWQMSDTPKDFLRIIDNYELKVKAQKSPVLNIQDLIDLKRNLQRQLTDVYDKQMKINPSMRENILKDAKSEVEQSVRKQLENIIPGYKDINNPIHKLLNLRPYLDRATNRISNYDITAIRMKDLFFGTAGFGIEHDPVAAVSAMVVGKILTDPRTQAYIGNKISPQKFTMPKTPPPAGPPPGSPPPSSGYWRSGTPPPAGPPGMTPVDAMFTVEPDIGGYLPPGPKLLGYSGNVAPGVAVPPPSNVPMPRQSITLKPAPTVTKPLDQSLIEDPLDKHPSPIKDAIQQKAADLQAEALGWEVVKIPGGVVRVTEEGGSRRGTVIGNIAGNAVSTFPRWFNRLGVSKKKVIEALEKIKQDEGKDKGRVVEELKQIIFDEAKEGGLRREGDLPPDQHFSDMIDAYKAGTLDEYLKQTQLPTEKPATSIEASKPGEQGTLLREQAKYPRANEGIRSSENIGTANAPLFETPKPPEPELPLSKTSDLEQQPTVDKSRARIEQLKAEAITEVIQDKLKSLGMSEYVAGEGAKLLERAGKDPAKRRAAAEYTASLHYKETNPTGYQKMRNEVASKIGLHKDAAIDAVKMAADEIEKALEK